MLINKSRYHVASDKKVLHKVGKRWMTVSALTLALLGGGTIASSLTTHAAVTPHVSSAQTDAAVKDRLNHGLHNTYQRQANVGHQQIGRVGQRRYARTNVRTNNRANGIQKQARAVHRRIMINANQSARPKRVRRAHRRFARQVNPIRRHTRRIMRMGAMSSMHHKRAITPELQSRKTISPSLRLGDDSQNVTVRVVGNSVDYHGHINYKFEDANGNPLKIGGQESSSVDYNIDNHSNVYPPSDTPSEEDAESNAHPGTTAEAQLKVGDQFNLANNSMAASELSKNSDLASYIKKGDFTYSLASGANLANVSDESSTASNLAFGVSPSANPSGSDSVANVSEPSVTVAIKLAKGVSPEGLDAETVQPRYEYKNAHGDTVYKDLGNKVILHGINGDAIKFTQTKGAHNEPSFGSVSVADNANNYAVTNTKLNLASDSKNLTFSKNGQAFVNFTGTPSDSMLSDAEILQPRYEYKDTEGHTQYVNLGGAQTVKGLDGSAIRFIQTKGSGDDPSFGSDSVDNGVNDYHVTGSKLNLAADSQNLVFSKGATAYVDFTGKPDDSVLPNSDTEVIQPRYMYQDASGATKYTDLGPAQTIKGLNGAPIKFSQTKGSGNDPTFSADDISDDSNDFNITGTRFGLASDSKNLVFDKGGAANVDFTGVPDNTMLTDYQTVDLNQLTRNESVGGPYSSNNLGSVTIKGLPGVKSRLTVVSDSNANDSTVEPSSVTDGVFNYVIHRKNAHLVSPTQTNGSTVDAINPVTSDPFSFDKSGTHQPLNIYLTGDRITTLVDYIYSANGHNDTVAHSSVAGDIGDQVNLNNLPDNLGANEWKLRNGSNTATFNVDESGNPDPIKIPVSYITPSSTQPSDTDPDVNVNPNNPNSDNPSPANGVSDISDIPAANQATDTIGFTDSDGDQLGDTFSMTGRKGATFSVSAPSGYKFQGGAASKSLTYDGQTHFFQVSGQAVKPASDVPFNPSNPNNHKHNSDISDISDTPNNPWTPSDNPSNPNNNPVKPNQPDNPAQPKNKADASRTFYVAVNKFSHGQFVQSYMKRFTEDGALGSTFTINPADFTPANYHANNTDAEVDGSVGNNGIDPDYAIFNYDADPAQPINLRFINDAGDPVGQETLHGDVDQKVVITDSNMPNSVKNGYHLPSKSVTTTYKFGLKPQTYTVGVSARGWTPNVNPNSDSTPSDTSSDIPVSDTIGFFDGDTQIGDDIKESGKAGSSFKDGTLTVPSGYKLTDPNASIPFDGQYHAVGIQSDPNSASNKLGSIDVLFENTKTGRRAASDIIQPSQLAQLGESAGDKLSAYDVLSFVNAPQGYKLDNDANNNNANVTVPDAKKTNSLTINVYGVPAGSVNGSGNYTPNTPSVRPSDVPSSPFDPAKPSDADNPDNSNNAGNTSHGYLTLYLVGQVNGRNKKVTVKTVSENGLNIGDTYTVKPKDYVPQGLKMNVGDKPLTGTVEPNGSLSNGTATWYYGKTESNYIPMPNIPNIPNQPSDNNNGSNSQNNGSNVAPNAEPANPASDNPFHGNGGLPAHMHNRGIINNVKQLDGLRYGEYAEYHGYLIAPMSLRNHFRYFKNIRTIYAHRDPTKIGYAESGAYRISRHANVDNHISHIFLMMKPNANNTHTAYQFTGYGTQRFATGNPDFTENAYLQTPDFSHAHRVTVIRGCIEYDSPHYAERNHVADIHKGETLWIKGVANIARGQMTRLQLTNGNWVTANKNFVRVVRSGSVHAVRSISQLESRLNNDVSLLTATSIRRYGRQELAPQDRAVGHDIDAIGYAVNRKFSSKRLSQNKRHELNAVRHDIRKADAINALVRADIDGHSENVNANVQRLHARVRAMR